MTKTYSVHSIQLNLYNMYHKFWQISTADFKKLEFKSTIMSFGVITLRKGLSSAQWDIILFMPDIDNKVQYSRNSIKYLFDKQCPYRSIRAPWLT